MCVSCQCNIFEKICFKVHSWNIVRQLITSVGEGLTVCDGSVRILTQALQYQLENHLLLAILALNGSSASAEVSQGEIRGVFEDLQIRLENFYLTKEQQVCSSFSSPLHNWITSMQKNIRKLSQELVYQPSRTGFKQLHVDVEVSHLSSFKGWCWCIWQLKIRHKPETYRMVNVFGQPARETAFWVQLSGLPLVYVIHLGKTWAHLLILDGSPSLTVSYLISDSRQHSPGCQPMLSWELYCQHHAQVSASLTLWDHK